MRIFFLIFFFLVAEMSRGLESFTEPSSHLYSLFQDFRFTLSDPLEFRVVAPQAEELRLELINPEKPRESYKSVVLSRGHRQPGEFVYVLSTPQIEAYYSNLVSKQPFRLQLKISSDAPLLDATIFQKNYQRNELSAPAG